MKSLDLSKEIKIIKSKIAEIGGYHITKDTRQDLYVAQCYFKDFDKYVKNNNIKTESITIFRNLFIEQSFKVGNVVYCRD